jgi:hypothetical protein
LAPVLAINEGETSMPSMRRGWPGEVRLKSPPMENQPKTSKLLVFCW